MLTNSTLIYLFKVHELCRETMGRHTCDKHSPISVVSKAFPNWDFKQCQNEEDVLWTPIRESPLEVQARAKQWLTQVWATPSIGAHVMLVNHSGFLKACWSVLGLGEKHFKNAQLLSVIIQPKNTPLVLSSNSESVKSS